MSCVGPVCRRWLVAILIGVAVLADAPPAAAVGEAVNGFPNWAERVIHEWMNRARVDPSLEMTACGANCVERACYSARAPLPWSEALNRAARFHSDEMIRQGYFAHNSACTVVSNISSLYPASCDGSASCACVGGSSVCSPTCTGFAQRLALFGAAASGEIIASPSDPNYAFYLWLYEPGDTTACQFTQRNGHRWLILTSSGAVGAGVSGYSTGDFGAGAAPAKIPSGAHYPQQAASVAVWANWYDVAGPSAATVNVDGVCTAMTLQRGTQANGAWSATLSGMATGCHRYYFSFVDSGGATVTYPTTGSLAIGSGGSCPDWDSARPAACGGPLATATVSPPPTATATQTETLTPSKTPTPSSTPTPTRTATPSPSRTATRTATDTPTQTPSSTRTPTRTPSNSPTGTATRTATRTATSTASVTASNSPTASATSTQSPTGTPTGSPTPSQTPSPTQTGTATATNSPSPSQPPTSTPTLNATVLPFGIRGHVYHYGNLQPVPNAQIVYSGPAGSGVTVTDAQGAYEIPEIGGQDWTIVARKVDTTAWSAITSFDASMLLQIAVGLAPATSANRLACDSNGDGRLTANDASMILRYRVGLQPNLPATGAPMCDSNWLFIPAAASAPNQTNTVPQMGGAACTMGAISFTPLAEQADGQDFLGVVLGDCNGSWTRP